MAERTRLAVVGAGDVWQRHYLPPLRSLGDRVEVVGIVDRGPGVAARAAAALEPWWSAAPVESVEDLVAAGLPIDGVINLTPAPAHAAVNRAVLAAGFNLYSEKPLAHSLADANELIETARKRRILFQCAPATAVTRRSRWLRELAASGRYGRPTLVVAHHADPGPAAWREYTGDPTPFYQEGVGPVYDHGVYRLNEMSLLMGPVARVQAMGAIGAPTRRVRGGPLTGQTIDVTTPDHVLMNLEFARGGLGQLLASFGTPETKAPWLEVHFPMATLSFGGKSWEPDAPVSLYVDDDGPDDREGWQDDLEVPRDTEGTPEAGVRHFVAAPRGEENPPLSPEHARHVLDITLKAYASIGDGQAPATETTFEG